MIALRQLMIKHFAVIILVFIIGAYLIVKAVPENSWDFWRVGSAQVLLSNKHWVNDGFFKNYFLFLPQGYSKTIRYFDDPELRQHARGITTGGLIGKRLYYTHYPGAYLLPTALLMKLGIEERTWLRISEILFSLTGLVLLYWIFFLISNRLVAFLGTLYYGMSVLFLDYADSLSAAPLEELLRVIIIFLSIVVLKKVQKNYFNYLIWVFYFILSLSSYDSSFFIFAWLVGLDILFNKKLNWKLLIFWASAPVLAFAVQLFQNILYLGWHDMLLDLYGAFKVQVVGSRSGFFISHLRRLIDPFSWFFGVQWYLGIIISTLGIPILCFTQKYLNSKYSHYPNYGSDMIKYLILGFSTTLFNFLFFPSLFFYQGRIIAVFGGLLVGILTTILIKETTLLFKTAIIPIRQCVVTFGILILLSSLWFIQGKRTYEYIKNWPNNVWPAKNLSFDKKIKNLTSGDKVVFQMLGTEQEISGSDRYPMAASEDEYYIGSPILGFTSLNDLVRDLQYLKNRSKFPFNIVIITDQAATMDKIVVRLRKNVSQKVPSPIIIDQKFILVIPEFYK